MSEPVWIDCESVADVPFPEHVAAQANNGRHVVLRFAWLKPDEVTALVSRLSAALPDYSVFLSSADLAPATITVVPVVSRSRVIEHRAEIVGAIEDYHRTSSTLIRQYESKTLAPEWIADEHGEHCRFKNLRTGQLVEAAFEEWPGRPSVDPYFFALFVRGFGVGA